MEIVSVFLLKIFLQLNKYHLTYQCISRKFLIRFAGAQDKKIWLLDKNNYFGRNIKFNLSAVLNLAMRTKFRPDLKFSAALKIFIFAPMVVMVILLICSDFFICPGIVMNCCIDFCLHFESPGKSFFAL